jgi:tetratricopeptide (TPR) repeat protein
MALLARIKAFRVLPLAAALTAPWIAAHGPVRADNRPGQPDRVASGLLIEYFEGFLADQDLDGFRLKVASRYDEAALVRTLEAKEVDARRAAALALGEIGTMKSNLAVSRLLADPDPVVRRLAQSTLWSLWFKADSPANNKALEDVSATIARGDSEGAEKAATALIERAPGFAEAINQRAIARFQLGRYDDSADDCRRVLKLNPVHIGALSGLAQCYIRLGDRRQALSTFRRALELQPTNEAIREMIVRLSEPDA